MSSPGGTLSRTLLSHVALRTPDVEDRATFYERVLGLVRHEAGDGCTRLGWGTGHHALELHAGEAGLDHVAFEVGDPGGTTALAARLRADGLSVEERQGEPEAIEVRDPDGNRVRFHGRVARTGEHSADPGRRPVRVQHATLVTADLEPMVAFYLRLGMRLTDRMGGEFAWLRTHVEHHSLAIVQAADTTGGLDHFSFDLDGWADFKVWADRVSDLGVTVQWGPGRHGPGNNLFLFIDDPDGNHIELSAEMERFFDDRADYAPRIWRAGPSTVNLWGGQVPQWRTTVA